jgi:hypothetical protein
LVRAEEEAMPNHRRRPFPNPRQYYTYVWRYVGEVIWVGHGKNNRGRPTCQASWSGRPAGLVDLLRAHSREIMPEYRPHRSKEEAVEEERRLIAQLAPRFNTAPQHGGWRGMHTPDGLERIAAAQRGRVYSKDECAARSRRMLGNEYAANHRRSK